MKKILFIDDDPVLQETLATLLGQNNYELISALNGEQGLLVAKNQDPDLIILDLVLPKKDGFVVLEELKSDDETKDKQVMVLTNLDEAKDVERALNLGAMTYLVKTNHTSEDILNKVNKIFKKTV
ncbi:MAG: response regulator [Candidatus Spechtbacterales bacterium]|nr:response regulator [Candidatus Spechtbacterales bacterium]